MAIMDILSSEVVDTIFKRLGKCATVKSVKQMSEKDKRLVEELIEALDSSEWRAVEMIKSSSPNPNLISESGYTLLQEAVRRGCLDATKELLKRKPDVNVKNASGQTALFIAAARNNGDVIWELAAAGANPDMECNKSTPLHLAASLGHEEAVWALLKAGATATVPDVRGDYPIHVAKRGAIQMLLEVCPELMFKRTLEGSTALHCAARRGSAEDVETLIGLDADLDLCNFDGQTPLACAVWARSVQSARALLRNGAKVNGRIRKSYTPLHVAALLGHVEMTMLLLSKGADFSLTAAHFKSGQGELRTPEELAKEQGHVWLSNLLRVHL